MHNPRIDNAEPIVTKSVNPLRTPKYVKLTTTVTIIDIEVGIQL